MPTEEDLGPELSRRLGYLLKRARIRLEELHESHMGPSGVSARELGVLLLFASSGPESQQEAARRLGVDRTTMVTLIDGLESRGLVARTPDPDDRRRNLVGLTAEGRRALRRGKRASDQAECELLAELDAADAARLRELLGRIAADEPRRRPA